MIHHVKLIIMFPTAQMRWRAHGVSGQAIVRYLIEFPLSISLPLVLANLTFFQLFSNESIPLACTRPLSSNLFKLLKRLRNAVVMRAQASSNKVEN